MNRFQFILLILISSSWLNCNSQGYDSLFIESIKKSIFKELKKELKGEIYTKWAMNDRPYIILYISPKDKIEDAADNGRKRYFNGTYCKDENDIKEKESEYNPNYFSFFAYKTFGNSAVELNNGLVSYPNEAQCFIMVHEIVHNYFSQQKIKIPYELNEALADLIANYFTLKYSNISAKIDPKLALKQVQINEEIYENVNSCVSKIRSSTDSIDFYLSFYEERIKSILKQGNAFQKHRYDYPVNTAYLLKNNNYSARYFFLKQILSKQKSISRFFKIIRKKPKDVQDWEKYLTQFL